MVGYKFLIKDFDFFYEFLFLVSIHSKQYQAPFWAYRFRELVPGKKGVFFHDASFLKRIVHDGSVLIAQRSFVQLCMQLGFYFLNRRIVVQIGILGIAIVLIDLSIDPDPLESCLLDRFQRHGFLT